MARLVWPGFPNYMLFTFRGLRTCHRTCLGRVGVRRAHGQDDGRDNLFFEPDQVRSPPPALDYTRSSCLGVLSVPAAGVSPRVTQPKATGIQAAGVESNSPPWGEHRPSSITSRFLPGRTSRSTPMSSSHCAEHGPPPKSRLPPLIIPPSEGWGQQEQDRVACGLKKLAVNGVCAATPPLTPVKSPLSLFSSSAPCERGSRPLPPLPISEDLTLDETDCEVEFLTSSDTDFLLEDCGLSDFRADGPGRRSFRGCGQINYAYFDTPTVSAVDLSQEPDQAAGAPSANPPPPQAHRRLRRSHSGPAGSFNKPAIRISSSVHRASPNSDDDKPEVPPRVPIPPRPAKPDYRRWSAEVTSSTYSDEDRPPKVPPREPLSRSNSRTPSPKSLPSYLNGVMPPTQSFAPDPKYVSSKALQRQHSEGAAGKAPCILPIIENGKKVSSTHYYLLPERPPYLDRFEKFFREAEETHGNTPVHPLLANGSISSAPEKLDLKPRVDPGGHVKRKHFSYVVSP